MITEVKKHCYFPNSPGIFSLKFYREILPNFPEFDFYLELYTWDLLDNGNSELVDVLPALNTVERLRLIDVLKASKVGDGRLETFTPENNLYTIDILRRNISEFEMTINVNDDIYKGCVEYDLLISINEPTRGMLQHPTQAEAELHEWSSIFRLQQ